MAEYIKNVMESVSFQETITKNLHIVTVRDTLFFNDSLTSQLKVLRIDEVLYISEQAKFAGSHQESVSEQLMFTEVLHPRVLAYNVGDVLFLQEALTGSQSVFEELLINETLTVLQTSVSSDVLVLTEAAAFNITKKIDVSELLNLTEGLVGLIIKDGMPVAIAPPYVIPGSPYVTGIFVQESPTGTVNGVNAAFIISYVPLSGTLQVYVNGVLQIIGTDYGFSGQTITFLAPAIPQVGDNMTAYYLR